MVKVPEIIKLASRELRKNQTKAEKIIWQELRYDKLGFRFLRQKPIYLYTDYNGLDRYIIPDFYCISKNLILEIDGDVHLLKNVYNLDLEKEKFLKKIGINVLRIKNSDIENNLEKVILKIKKELS